MKIYLDMVGCRLNQSELEIMARHFKRAGHILVGDPAEADLAVVNTCTVTAAAAADSRKVIRRLERSGVERIIATGCWSELHPDQALELPGVSRVVPNQDKDRLVASLFSLPEEIFDQEPIERVAIPGSRQKTRAFIKVQDGCRHQCAYCVTTIARGGPRSQSPERVIAEIQAALRGGAREAVLTGVQLGSWGADLKPRRRLSSLVESILARTDLPRLRLSSIEPWDVDQDLVSLFQDGRLARHLHLPLQSGSAAVMRRMARPFTPGAYAELAARVRKAVPEIALTTDIMSGFPGETEDEFRESLDFIRKLEFADGHVFVFSAREGTPAAGFADQVPHPIRKERSAQIREVLAASSTVYRSGFLGSRLSVLWEQSSNRGNGTWEVTGLTDNYLRVEARSEGEVWNRFSEIRVTGLTAEGISGEIESTSGG